MAERTLVLIKPEGVKRGITGKIIDMVETTGLKIVAMRMVWPDKRTTESHYPLEREWYENLWNNTKKGYEARGQKLSETPLELGKRVRDGLVRHLMSGPIVAMVVEGNDAIASMRKIVGNPSPNRAEASTIRGRFSTDSYELADAQKRTTLSIIHASDGKKTAEREIGIWFDKKQVYDYGRLDEFLVYGK